MASCSRCILILFAILVISLASKPVFADRYDDEEAINRAAQQLNQIEQNERERAKREYNYKHVVIPDSAAEDWKQIQYNAERKKESEKSYTPPSSSETQTPTDNTPGFGSAFLVTLMVAAILMFLVKKAKNMHSRSVIKDNCNDLQVSPKNNVISEKTFTPEEKTCLQCAETVKFAAKVCIFCRHEF